MNWRWPPRPVAMLYLALSIGTAFMHAALVDHPLARDRRMGMAVAILAGQGPAPDQYRPLVHWMAAGLQTAGLDFDAAYNLIRAAGTFASAGLVHGLLARWYAPWACLVGTLWLLAALPLTYLHYYFQPTDPLNLAAFVACAHLLASRKDAACLALAAAGMIQRETQLMLAPFYLWLRYDELCLPRLLGRAAVGTVVLGAVYLGIRHIYGVRPYYTDRFVLLADNLFHWRAWTYLLLLFGPAVALAIRAESPAPRFFRRAVGWAPFFLGGHYLVTAAEECRLWLPLMPFAIGLALAGLPGALVNRDDKSPVGADLQVGPSWLAVHWRAAYAALFLAFCASMLAFAHVTQERHVAGLSEGMNRLNVPGVHPEIQVIK